MRGVSAWSTPAWRVLTLKKARPNAHARAGWNSWRWARSQRPSPVLPLIPRRDGDHACPSIPCLGFQARNVVAGYMVRVVSWWGLGLQLRSSWRKYLLPRACGRGDGGLFRFGKKSIVAFLSPLSQAARIRIGLVDRSMDRFVYVRSPSSCCWRGDGTRCGWMGCGRRRRWKMAVGMTTASVSGGVIPPNYVLFIWIGVRHGHVIGEKIDGLDGASRWKAGSGSTWSEWAQIDWLVPGESILLPGEQRKSRLNIISLVANRFSMATATKDSNEKLPNRGCTQHVHESLRAQNVYMDVWVYAAPIVPQQAAVDGLFWSPSVLCFAMVWAS